MSSGIVIPIQENGLLDLMNKIDQLSKKIATLPSHVKINFSGMGNPGGLSSGSAGQQAIQAQINQTQKLTNAYKAALGPAQALVKAQLNLQNAKVLGNPAQQFDAQFLLGQAQNRMNRAQRGPTHPMMQAILSSRFGVGGGGGVQPLVGRSLAALASLGPAGMAAAAAVTSVAALGMAANHAAQLIRGLAGARFTSGGTPGQVGALAGIAAGTGASVGDIAAQTRDLALRMQGDYYARRAASQYGVQADLHANNPALAKLNTADNYVRLAKALMADKNENRAIRNARALGMENILPMRDMSKPIRDRLMTMGADMMTPQGRQSAANLQGALGILQLSFQKLAISCIPLIEGFAGGALLLSDIINHLIKTAKTIALIPSFMYEGLKKVLGLDNEFKKVNESIKKIWATGQAEDERIKALKENTQELKNWRNGIYGGGERARGAFPSRTSAYWSQSLPPEAMQLGAFSL